ncbi:MAG: aromatic ring-hydroxylating dioxygenase subunit alpha [Microbacteriaceae bacterium]|nr:aromatic ring-hydroxylating dioxygenase subunit alpha [Burkholderiaceae bacterium]
MTAGSVPVEVQAWHPVALMASVGEAPVAVQVLGERLVLWRQGEGEGAVQAWADRCPHRGAQLSMGCVRDGQLECPYHGWRFDRAGQVVRVPAQPGFVPPASHRATVFDTVERYGLVWVRLRSGGETVPAAFAASMAEPPAFAAESEPRLRKLNCGPYDVATSAPRIVENFLDLAHFGFVHEGWLGDRAHTALADYRIDNTTTGFIASGCTAWQPKSSVQAQGGAEVQYTYEVNAPYAAVLTKVPEPAGEALADFRESIALFICPLTPESSRVWFRLAVTDFESPDATLQAFQHTIFLQDQPVLESQSPKRLPISDRAPVRELHSAADRSAMAYRRYLLASGITYGTC